ncbi:6910_t:CDS:1, partial [Cetraspora pellucida]
LKRESYAHQNATQTTKEKKIYKKQHRESKAQLATCNSMITTAQFFLPIQHDSFSLSSSIIATNSLMPTSL